MPIKTFGGSVTESFFLSGEIKKGANWFAVRHIAKRKLDILNYAVRLSDLKSPPGNNLEALKGALSGYYSIRINKQWRVIFKWSEDGIREVKIIDYHK